MMILLKKLSKLLKIIMMKQILHQMKLIWILKSTYKIDDDLFIHVRWDYDKNAVKLGTTKWDSDMETLEVSDKLRKQLWDLLNDKRNIIKNNIKSAYSREKRGKIDDIKSKFTEKDPDVTLEHIKTFESFLGKTESLFRSRPRRNNIN